MGKEQQMARAAGKIAKQWLPTVRNSGKIAKHVLPAAFKPVHSLWHEIIAFIFLMFAGLGAWRLWRTAGTLEPGRLALVVIFVVVMAAYGISSYRKSRRISRS